MVKWLTCQQFFDVSVRGTSWALAQPLANSRILGTNELAGTANYGEVVSFQVAPLLGRRNVS